MNASAKMNSSNTRTFFQTLRAEAAIRAPPSKLFVLTIWQSRQSSGLSGYHLPFALVACGVAFRCVSIIRPTETRVSEQAAVAKIGTT
jgi:hypothetical protein